MPSVGPEDLRTVGGRWLEARNALDARAGHVEVRILVDSMMDISVVMLHRQLSVTADLTWGLLEACRTCALQYTRLSTAHLQSETILRRSRHCAELKRIIQHPRGAEACQPTQHSGDMKLQKDDLERDQIRAHESV